MHAAAISWVFITLVGQVGGDYGAGGYGQPPANAELGPRMSVTAGAKTRSTRATNPLTDRYPPSRVATQPRYAADTSYSDNSSLPPVGNTERVAQEDPQSALANKVLHDLLQPTRGDQNVRSLRLYDALERTSGSQQQFTAIKSYWDWTLAVVELHGVVEEDTILARVNAPRSAHEQAAHQANRKASRSRLEDTQLDVAAKVVDLLDSTGLRGTSTALRPADVPYVSTYNTNFSRIFPGNSAPATLRKINQTLPYALKVVRSRSDSYVGARQALTAAESAYQGGQCSYDDFVNAMGLVRSQRRAFLDSVHDYNFAIAEYALSIAGPGLQRETVVSMLIRTNTGSYRGAASDYSGQVQPATATAPNYSSGNWSTYLVTPVEYAAPVAEARHTWGDYPSLDQNGSTLLR
jgi:hypothetical protein